MKTMFRLNMMLGFAFGLMVLGSCVGQNSAVLDADSNPQTEESAQGLSGDSALNQEAGADDFGNLGGDNSLPNPETNSPENPGDGGMQPNPTGINVAVIDKTKTGIFQGVQGGKVTSATYCTQKFNECKDEAGTISAEAACGTSHQKCMEYGNCQTEKAVCLENKVAYSECSYNYDLCDLGKECLQVRNDCLSVYGGSPSQCQNAYKDCQTGIKVKYDHCIQLRNQCSSNYQGNAQQCQTVYNDCLDNI